MTAAATMMHSTKITILLSLNAVAILVAGILIASALGFNLGDFRVVSANNDENGEELQQDSLDLDGATIDKTHEQISLGSGGMNPDLTSSGKYGWISTDPVPSGQLWNEEEVTIYESTSMDICVGGGLTDLGSMYWQTSNRNVISGFYSTARTWLGYNSKVCRYPVIKGTGSSTITAGTYDGLRRDSIKVNVIPIPIEEWKKEVLTLTNKFRAENGLPNLEWGGACERAAQIRVEELVQLYSHTRPNGEEWSTVCAAPGGTVIGENLMAGNGASTPTLAVEAWINSPKHRVNLLNPNFTKLSVGLYFNLDTQYEIYWSQIFSSF